MLQNRVAITKLEQGGNEWRWIVAEREVGLIAIVKPGSGAFQAMSKHTDN